MDDDEDREQLNFTQKYGDLIRQLIPDKAEEMLAEIAELEEDKKELQRMRWDREDRM